MERKSILLNNVDVLDLSMGARLVGIRWDLIDWALVFDMDKPISEAENSLLYRIWIVFDGVSEICFPFENVRLPNGCFFTSCFSASELSKGFFRFSASALLPTYDAAEKCLEPVAKIVSIKAKSMFGIRSTLSVEASPNLGWLSRNDRNLLASDDEMLEALSEWEQMNIHK